MKTALRDWGAVAALALILLVTASWWALALWPVEPAAPQWLLRTREVCFGNTATGLPNAGGWLLLIGQPLGMLVLLATVWPQELRASLKRLSSRVIGQVIVGLSAAAIFAGLVGVTVRVSGATGEPFSTGADQSAATASLVRLSDTAPAMELVDQHGRTVTLEAFRGRPVIVTFAYAHCETVCPLIVSDVLAAQTRMADRQPVLLIITLDPWRDTPSRLPSIAAAWRLAGDARVLSGDPDRVDRVLNAWRIPRVRNERTGDLSHPSVVYVIGPDGKIAYAIEARADAIAAALRAL